jgi:hypothetical protein
MSLFFAEQRRPRVAAQVLTPDWDAALEAISRHCVPEGVAAIGSLLVHQAHALIAKCREVEPLLLKAIQDGVVVSQTSAVDFLRDHTDGFFPAAKFVARMKANVGSEGSPATWPQVVAAARSEDV